LQSLTTLLVTQRQGSDRDAQVHSFCEGQQLSSSALAPPLHHLEAVFIHDWHLLLGLLLLLAQGHCCRRIIHVHSVRLQQIHVSMCFCAVIV
jgi:hypothetical protein